MTIAIKRYKDGTYTPLSKPWSRRIDYGTPKKKKTFKERYSDVDEQVKKGIYKRNWLDKTIDTILD